MLLSDRDLKKLVETHELVTPFIPTNCEGATINLTLDKEVKKHISTKSRIMINKVKEEEYESIDISSENFYLNPNQSVLVQSYEYFKIPIDVAAIVFERYSIKLSGLVVSPASYMNPGYEGRLSFLVTNNSAGPIQLVPGVKFSQMGIMKLSSSSEKPYQKQDAKYMGSTNVNLSKLHLDREIQQYVRDEGLGEISEREASAIGKHFMSEMNNNAKKYAEMIRQKLGDLDGQPS